LVAPAFTSVLSSELFELELSLHLHLHPHLSLSLILNSRVLSAERVLM
jgi:hypothetical protein